MLWPGSSLHTTRGSVPQLAALVSFFAGLARSDLPTRVLCLGTPPHRHDLNRYDLHASCRTGTVDDGGGHRPPQQAPKAPAAKRTGRGRHPRPADENDRSFLLGWERFSVQQAGGRRITKSIDINKGGSYQLVSLSARRQKAMSTFKLDFPI